MILSFQLWLHHITTLDHDSEFLLSDYEIIESGCFYLVHVQTVVLSFFGRHTFCCKLLIHGKGKGVYSGSRT